MMQVKNLFTDEDAVSPVIGVILMVAITVILAAVIGAFVLGIGGSQEQVPQASWEWQQDDTAFSSTDCGEDSTTYVQVSHQGGGEIDTGNLELAGQSCPDGTISAGDSLYAGGASGQVSLVWNSPTSDKSSILSDYEVK